MVAEVWKRLGDEILFYIAHPNHESLLKIPSSIYSALGFIIDGLMDFNKASVVQLSVKATLWSAVVYNIEKIPNKKIFKLFNIVTVEETPNKKILDFLGPDIDTGFRIAKHASPGKLIIDAYLAWYITKYDNNQDIHMSDNMRIVSLEDLKGVWNGRRYPIVWYCENWDDINTIFQYDEEYNSEIVKRIKEKRIGYLPETKDLSKILKEVNLLNYAERFDKSIKRDSEKSIMPKIKNPVNKKYPKQTYLKNNF
jgi:hypothetical protein